MITEIEDFFADGCGRCTRFATDDCSARIWAKGMADLRRICRDAGLHETVKWGHPCYTSQGRNIAIIGAMRRDFRLSFFNAALMQDPAGVLQKQGPNTQHADMIRFEDANQVGRMTAVIASYLTEAISYATAGTKPVKPPIAFALPEELANAFNSDAALASAFQALTPGRQKSYVIALASAKTTATRVARIGKFRDKIIAGKGALER